MPLDTFELATTIIMVVTMPLLIWVNYRKREGGLQGYLWRESPTLMWLSLVLLSLILFLSVAKLLTHYGFLSVETEKLMSMIIGIPMVVPLLAIIGLAIAAAARYVRARPSS